MVCVIQEYETVMKGLDRNAPSVPPQNSPQEAQQVEMWKKYIQWEKSNPLRTEDQTLITKRGDFLWTVILWSNFNTTQYIVLKFVNYMCIQKACDSRKSSKSCRNAATRGRH